MAFEGLGDRYNSGFGREIDDNGIKFREFKVEDDGGRRRNHNRLHQPNKQRLNL